MEAFDLHCLRVWNIARICSMSRRRFVSEFLECDAGRYFAMHNTLLFERLLILSIDKFEKLFMRSFKSEILHIKAEWKLGDTTVWFASERVRATPLHWHQNWGKMLNQLHSYSIFGCCWTITTFEPMLSIFDLLCFIISVRRCQSVCLIYSESHIQHHRKPTTENPTMRPYQCQSLWIFFIYHRTSFFELNSIFSSLLICPSNFIKVK